MKFERKVDLVPSLAEKCKDKIIQVMFLIGAVFSSWQLMLLVKCSLILFQQKIYTY